MNDDKKKYLQQRYPNAKFPAPFAKMLGIHFTKIEDGFVESKVTVDKAWTNPFGIAHGGFLFTILDETLGSASCSILDQKIYHDVKALSTTNHDIFFHSPARPNDELIIKAQVISCRKNMIFVEGNIKKNNEVLIAESKGIWFIKR